MCYWIQDASYGLAFIMTIQLLELWHNMSNKVSENGLLLFVMHVLD
jgi:hypothetical protein